MENYTLNNGTQVPSIAFGCYNPKGGDNVEIIRTAIECGYTYLDTASLYETERAVGTAVKESGVLRENLQIATKVWIDEMGYRETKEALYRSLDRLQMDYVDVYLIHWPKQSVGEEGWKERDLETYTAMEELCKEGLIKALGLSNFLPHHLNNILRNCRIKPVLDQLELHPGYSQELALATCRENGIIPQAWSPLGRGDMVNNEVVAQIAAKYGKSVPQICLRFLLDKGVMPIAKASSEAHMKSNLDVFDFKLEEDDLLLLSCMPQNTWLGEHPDFAMPSIKCNRNQ